jgi:hypothetical protein
MVKGNFQCIGTPQHIKTKYGEGFEIEVKLQPFPQNYIAEVINRRKLTNAMVLRKNVDGTLVLLELEP